MPNDTTDNRISLDSARVDSVVRAATVIIEMHKQGGATDVAIMDLESAVDALVEIEDERQNNSKKLATMAERQQA